MKTKTINFKENKQLKAMLESTIKENRYTYVGLAKILNTKEQYLRAKLNKKNINCDDMKTILNAIGYDLVIEFRPKKDDIDNADNTTNTKGTNNTTLTNLLEEIINDNNNNDDIKVGYCGDDLIDSWLDNHGYTINHNLYNNGLIDSKVLNSIKEKLFIAISFKRYQEWIDKGLLVKIDK